MTQPTDVDGHDSFYWAEQLKKAEEDKPHDPKYLLIGIAMLALAVILHVFGHIIFVWLYVLGGLAVLGGIVFLASKGTDPAPIRAKYEEALRREKAARQASAG